MTVITEQENDTPGNIDEPGVRVPAGNIKQTRIYWFKVQGDVYRVSGMPKWYPVQERFSIDEDCAFYKSEY